MPLSMSQLRYLPIGHLIMRRAPLIFTRSIHHHNSRMLISRLSPSQFCFNTPWASRSSTSPLVLHHRSFAQAVPPPIEEETGEKKRDKAKVKRAYALGGCLIFIWLSTHGILLYRRRSEYRALNQKMPPIPYDEFAEKYIASGQVKTIIYQPHFEVGNVYLHSPAEQLMKKTVVAWFHAAPDKFSRPPDVRFFFEGDEKDLDKKIKAAVKSIGDSGVEIREIEFDVDKFPSYRELSFIVASTFFTLAAVSMMK